MLFSVLLASTCAAAEISPLCTDLFHFSCSPGSYKDGTGEIKSEKEIANQLAAYTDKSRIFLHDRFLKILDDSGNTYFKDLALSGLGLKNSPQCTSTSPEDLAACRENLIDGLTDIAQSSAMGNLVPKTGLERRGDLADLMYITQNGAFHKVIQELDNQTQKNFENPELINKIQSKVFPKIKSLIVARLQVMPISDEQKKIMISKVSSISFDGTDCGNLNYKRKQGEDIVASLLVPNAFYNPVQNNFRICAGFLLQSTSEFQIGEVIAHELSHSLDPCNIASGPSDLGLKYSNPQDIQKMENEYPIKNVLKCLRDKRSVGARNFDLEMQASIGPGAENRCANYGCSSEPSKRNGGARSGAPPDSAANFCRNDQVGESFADWMAAEVLPTYMEDNYKLTTDQYRNGYANVFRTGCQGSFGQVSSDIHPALELRINKILLANPKIQSQMGCPASNSSVLYCDPNKVVTDDSQQKAKVPALPTAEGIEGVR